MTVSFEIKNTSEQHLNKTGICSGTYWSQYTDQSNLLNSTPIVPYRLKDQNIRVGRSDLHGDVYLPMKVWHEISNTTILVFKRILCLDITGKYTYMYFELHVVNIWKQKLMNDSIGDYILHFKMFHLRYYHLTDFPPWFGLSCWSWCHCVPWSWRSR